MADALTDFLLQLIGQPLLVIVLASMVPLIELKGAIPIGLKLTDNLLQSALLSYAGSTVIFFLIFFLMIPVFILLKKIPLIKKLVVKIELMLKNRANKLAEKNNGNSEKEMRRFLQKALFLFVAVPFPVTGVWTGTAIAVFLKMRFRDSILPIFLGNLVAGSIITLLTYFFRDYVDIIIYVLFGIVIIMLIITIIKIATAKPKDTEIETKETPTDTNN
ncbi:MAG: small multi-drug export protein [Clostridia bacterium]|nr:small multi-drug export protein [Clostridia bacterium]